MSSILGGRKMLMLKETGSAAALPSEMLTTQA